MAEYLGKIHSLHEFNQLLPFALIPQKLEQQSKFFMLLALHGLFDDYSHVRYQFWGPLFSPILLLFVLSFCVC